MSAAANTVSSPKKFQFVGGDLCLDFTNTMGGKRGVAPREYLNAYTDFVSWCRQAGLLDSSKAQALARRAARRAEESARALRRAIALRETIYRIFAALASEESPAASDSRSGGCGQRNNPHAPCFPRPAPRRPASKLRPAMAAGAAAAA